MAFWSLLREFEVVILGKLQFSNFLYTKRSFKIYKDLKLEF